MKRAFITVVALLVASAVYGQADQAATRSAIVTEIVSAGDQAAGQPNVTRPFEIPIESGSEGLIITYLIATHSEREGYKALLTAMEARVDRQVGATPASNGSTSLAMKGLVPELLGIAVENGALNKEVKGTTFTFRATPMGIIKALQGRGLLDMYADYSKDDAARYASRLSVSAGFDTSRGSSAGTFTADSQQLATWAVRYIVVNGRDPAGAPYADLWKALASNSRSYMKARAAIAAAIGGDCRNRLDGTKNPAPKWPEFCKWQDDLIDNVTINVDQPWVATKDTAAAAARFRNILEPALAKLEKLPHMPDAVTKALDAYVAELTTVQKGIDNIYEFVGKGPLLTFDWSTARDATLPDLYTATGIFEAALGASRKTDMTVNVAASFYRSQPAGASHSFKSFDLTAQLEHPLGSILLLPSVTAALSGRYSYLPNDTVASNAISSSAGTVAAATTAVAPKGNIVVVQAKLTVPITGSGIKVPLSVTASNRTELIQEADVRASFGFTFDLDTFVTALSSRGR
jgi:hypothetical protein